MTGMETFLNRTHQANVTKLKAVKIGTRLVDIGFPISDHLEIPNMENLDVRTVQN